MPLLDAGSYRDVDLPTIVHMERKLPWYGWPHLPLGLLVCVAAILAAYRVPVSDRAITALVAGGGVLGGFCGYGCGLVMVSTPDLVKTGRLHWRRTRVLRGLLFAFAVVSAAALVGVAVGHVVLLVGASGLHPFTLSLQAGLYLALAAGNTALAVLETLRVTKVLNGVSVVDDELTGAAAGLPA
jgi:hypothetical protein